jgi:SAM-dependent methyltransferase
MPDSITRFPRRVVRGLKRRLRGKRPTQKPAPTATAPAAATKPAPRTIDDIDTLHEFWRQPAPDGNVPATYVGPIGRSEVLLKLISDLPPETRILEVGCNVGRNLAYLVDHGYPNVEGIEISPHAVELLRQTYPQLADSDIHLGSAEDVLPGLADDSFDLVFTMAVIEHIHPSSTKVFDDMARVGKSILSIEPPGRTSHRQYPHDVPKIFTSRGLRMVSSTPMSEFPQTANDKGIAIFSAYRFERTS